MIETCMNVQTTSKAGIDPRHADASAVAMLRVVERGDPAAQADLATLRAHVRAGLAAFGSEFVRHCRLGWEE